MRKPALTAVAVWSLTVAAPYAPALQDPVINRGAPTTYRGEIVDITCYKQKSVAGGTGAAHVACAKECVTRKDAPVGILTDGDGLFKLWGAFAKDKYAKLIPYIGQTVEITGTEVVLSNNYDVRSFDVQKITVVKKTGGSE